MKNYNNDILDAFLYPKYQKIARFIPESVSPNHLTVIGFFFGLCASFSLALISDKASVLLSAVFFVFMVFF